MRGTKSVPHEGYGISSLWWVRNHCDSVILRTKFHEGYEIGDSAHEKERQGTHMETLVIYKFGFNQLQHVRFDIAN